MDDTQVISWADFRAWERQLASSGARPIRLRGRIDIIDLVKMIPHRERGYRAPASGTGCGT